MDVSDKFLRKHKFATIGGVSEAKPLSKFKLPTNWGKSYKSTKGNHMTGSFSQSHLKNEKLKQTKSAKNKNAKSVSVKRQSYISPREYSDWWGRLSRYYRSQYKLVEMLK